MQWLLWCLLSGPHVKHTLTANTDLLTSAPLNMNRVIRSSELKQSLHLHLIKYNFRNRLRYGQTKLKSATGLFHYTGSENELLLQSALRLNTCSVLEALKTFFSYNQWWQTNGFFPVSCFVWLEIQPSVYQLSLISEPWSNTVVWELTAPNVDGTLSQDKMPCLEFKS